MPAHRPAASKFCPSATPSPLLAKGTERRAPDASARKGLVAQAQITAGLGHHFVGPVPAIAHHLGLRHEKHGNALVRAHPWPDRARCQADTTRPGTGPRAAGRAQSNASPRPAAQNRRAGGRIHRAQTATRPKPPRPAQHRHVQAGRLLQQGVKETVVVTRPDCPGARRACPRLPGNKWPGDGSKLGIGVVRKKRCDLPVALGLEHRTGAVQQAPAGLEQRPQRLQQSCDCSAASCATSISRRSQRTSGWRRTMPEAVQGASSKMASNGAPPPGLLPPVWRARRHRPPAPGRSGPGAAGCRGCARLRCGIHLQRRDLQGEPAARQHSSKCAVLPPGAAQASSTRKGCVRSSPLQQQGRRHLRGSVLHRHPALSKARQRLHRHGLCQLPRPCGPPAIASILIAASACWYCAGVHFCLINPQRHGRVCVVRLQDAAATICGWSCRKR